MNPVDAMRHEFLADVAESAERTARELGVPADVAEQVGCAVADMMCADYAGIRMYINQDMGYRLAPRDKEICQLHNGALRCRSWPSGSACPRNASARSSSAARSATLTSGRVSCSLVEEVESMHPHKGETCDRTPRRMVGGPCDGATCDLDLSCRCKNRIPRSLLRLNSKQGLFEFPV